MIPTLYTQDATVFTNNGSGKLTDAISGAVTEERNGKYELIMQYPVDGIHFGEITQSCLIKAKPADNKDPQLFRVYSISKPIDGKCTIKAEHISYQLSFIPVAPFGEQTAVAQALQGLKTNAAESCPFSFWTDKTSTGTFEVKEPKSIRACLGGSQGSILDAFGGGEYEWDGYTVKLYQHRGADNGVVIRYGKNLTDLEQEEAIDSVITGVMPYWLGRDGDSTVLVTLPEKVLHAATAANYPFQRTAVLDCSTRFKEQPTEAQLRTYANSYISATGVGVPKVHWKISFVPLWQSEEYKDIANLEHVNLCDTVTVQFAKLGISATAKVIKTEYDFLRERYISIELGDARTSLADSVKADINSAQTATEKIIEETESNIHKEIEEAIAGIVVGDDGNIVFTYNSNNERTQILAMDNADIALARKILMINYQGIGGFSNGLDDTSGYTLAITTDGKVRAESVAAGTIKAALLMGNVFKIGGSSNGDGVLEVYNASNTKIGEWSKNGLLQYDGTRQSGFKTYTMPVVALYSSGGTTYTMDSYTGSGLLLQDTSTGCIDFKAFTANGILELINLGTQNQRTNKGVTIRAHRQIRGRDTSDSNYEYVLNELFYAGRVENTIIHHSESAGEYTEVGTLRYGNGIVEVRSGTDAGQQAMARLNGNINISASTASGYTFGVSVNASGANIYEQSNGSDVYRLQVTSSVIKHNGNKLAYDSSSSARYKHDIAPIHDPDLDPHKLLDLAIVQFVFNHDHQLQYADMQGKRIPGLIAEDVAEIYPAAAITDPETERVESWDERRIIPGMLALIQEQAKKIEELEKRVAALERGK